MRFPESAQEIISEIEPGCRLFYITQREIQVEDLLRLAAKKIGPYALDIVTWTLGADAVSQLKILTQKRAITGLRIVVDRSFAGFHPDRARHLLEFFGSEIVRLSNNHAKIMVLKNDQWGLVLRGSMNFGRNVRWENLDVSDDTEMADYCRAFVNRIFETVSPECLERGDIKEPLASFYDMTKRRNGANPLLERVRAKYARTSQGAKSSQDRAEL